jgi:hypothetical protein
MSKIITELNPKIFLELTPAEAKALAAICGYGPKPFIEWFHRNCGKHYLAPFINSVPSLFEKARTLDRAVDNYEKAVKDIRIINC